MARDQGWLVNGSQYVAARMAAMGLTTFDADAALTAGRCFGRLVHRLDRRHRQRACAHIAQAFPNWSAERVDATARAAMEHMAQLVVEVVHTPRALNPQRLNERIVFRNLDPLLERLEARQPALLVTGHLGNWEVPGYTLAMMGYDLDALARPIDNPLVDQWLLGIRRRRGMRVITKWNASEQMLRVVRHGGALAFVADQNAGKHGIFVPYFGRLASTYKSIGLLAMRYRVPVMCGYGHRLDGRFRYEIGLVDRIDPEDWEGREDPLYYITARYCRAIETMVRMRPEQYLWVHRRWKSRPAFEKAGQPMPEKLRRQLLSLPWMDEQQVQALEQAGPAEPEPVAQRPGV